MPTWQAPPARGSAPAADETLLMLAVQRGERTAFEQLYNLHYAGLSQFLRRVLLQHEQVQELVEQVFLEAWYASADYRREITVAGWLAELAYPHVLIRARHRGSEPCRPGATSRLTRRIAGLPFAERMVVSLAYQMKCSPNEIARITRSSVELVNWRLHRALSKTRRWLGDSAPRPPCRHQPRR